MIVREELLAKLRRVFDLNLYEVKLWAALLSRGVSTAGELSDIANVPRSRSYDVLESLEKKGFVILKLGKPIKYIAIPPKEVVDRVKKNMHLTAQQKIKRLESIRNSEMLTELDQLHTQGIDLIDHTDLTGALRGRHNVYNHLDLMIKNAKKNVSIMTTTQGFMRKVEGLKNSLETVKKKGVDIKIAAPITKECKDSLKEIKGIAQVRHMPKDLNGRFCVVDGKDVVFIALDDQDVHPTNDMGIWLNTAFTAKSMKGLFDVAWKDMKPAEKVVK